MGRVSDGQRLDALERHHGIVRIGSLRRPRGGIVLEIPRWIGDDLVECQWPEFTKGPGRAHRPLTASRLR